MVLPIANFGLASNRRYRQGDEMKEEVCFVDVTVFGATGEAAAKYLDKGRKVVIEGRLRFHAWETEGGAKRSKVDVVADRVNFLPRANKNGNGGANDGSASSTVIFHCLKIPTSRFNFGDQGAWLRLALEIPT